ncbi:MAG: hypothetical protein AB2754_15885 [Candidatus Thiodiazotropha endolucinida]
MKAIIFFVLSLFLTHAQADQALLTVDCEGDLTFACDTVYGQRADTGEELFFVFSKGFVKYLVDYTGCIDVYYNWPFPSKAGSFYFDPIDAPYCWLEMIVKFNGFEVRVWEFEHKCDQKPIRSCD